MVIRLRTRLPPREIRLLTRETLTQVPKEKRAVLPSLTVTMMKNLKSPKRRLKKLILMSKKPFKRLKRLHVRKLKLSKRQLNYIKQLS